MSRSLLASATNRFRNLRYSYLVVPGFVVLAFVAFGVLMAEVDELTSERVSRGLFPGGSAAARSVLTAIATSLATVAGVSFSITVLSLQLVSQQFTPRALRTFLGDRLNQTIAGIFIGGFLYCLVVLRSVGEEQEFQSGLSVLLAIVIAFVALGALLVFISHMGNSIQVSTISDRIAHGTLHSVERLYPREYGRPEDEDPEAVVAEWHAEGKPTLVFASRPGFVQALDDVPETIQGEGFRVQVVVAPGDFVTEKHPLAAVWTREDPDGCAQALRRAISVSNERDLEQDTGYGLRQLADIAVKALSPSVNDPTTATTCIGYLQATVERLATRSWPAAVRRVDERELTFVFRVPTFAEYVESLVQIGRYAEDARVVHSLLSACLRVAEAAESAGASDRVAVAVAAARRIRARPEALDEEEQEQLDAVMDALPTAERVPAAGGRGVSRP